MCDISSSSSALHDQTVVFWRVIQFSHDDVVKDGAGLRGQRMSKLGGPFTRLAILICFDRNISEHDHNIVGGREEDVNTYIFNSHGITFVLSASGREKDDIMSG